MIKTKVLPISRARVRLGEVVERVREKHEPVILEKNGIEVAALISIDDLEDFLELNDPAIQKRIERSYREYKAGKSIPAEEVFAEAERIVKAKRR